MKLEEEIVSRYLEHLGLGDITYEPEPNRTPYFLVAKKVAVEVRRLNYNFESGLELKGAEQSEFPLFNNITEVLQSLGAPTNGRSWFVKYEFRRPVAVKDEIKRRVLECVSRFELSLDEEFTRVYEDGLASTFFQLVSPCRSATLLAGTQTKTLVAV